MKNENESKSHLNCQETEIVPREEKMTAGREIFSMLHSQYAEIDSIRRVTT